MLKHQGTKLFDRRRAQLRWSTSRTCLGLLLRRCSRISRIATWGPTERRLGYRRGAQVRRYVTGADPRTDAVSENAEVVNPEWWRRCCMGRELSDGIAPRSERRVCDQQCPQYRLCP